MINKKLKKLPNERKLSLLTNEHVYDKKKNTTEYMIFNALFLISCYKIKLVTVYYLSTNLQHKYIAENIMTH